MASPCFALKPALAACLGGLVLACAGALAAPPAPPAAAASAVAPVRQGNASGIYIGSIGQGDTVLVSLRGSRDGAAGSRAG